MSSQGWIPAVVAVLAVAATDLSGAELTCATSANDHGLLWVDQRPSPECRCCAESTDTWQVTASAVFLHRSRPIATDLLVDRTAGTVVLNAGDFDLGVHSGFDVSLARRIGECFGGEARYFGIDQWNVALNRPTTLDNVLEFNALPPLFVPAGSEITASHNSELHNVEINGLYHWCDRWTLLAGFRYLELDEQLRIDSIGADEPFSYQAATRNRLYGGQLGANVVLWDRGGRFTADAIGKAGIFGNAAAQNSSFAFGFANLTDDDNQNPAAFLGEIGITGRYRISQRWSATVGYQLLWINQVALATEQPLGSGIDASGDTFYHGATVGLQYVR